MTPEMISWAVYGIVFVGGIAVRHFWPSAPVPSVPAPAKVSPIVETGNPAFDAALALASKMLSTHPLAEEALAVVSSAFLASHSAQTTPPPLRLA